MARGRFISESVAKDARLNSLSVEAELVYLMTIPHLDRDGLIDGDPDVLWGTVCPKRRQFIDRITSFIQEWATAGLITMYDTDEGPVLWFTGFAKNQVGLRYDRETPSTFPPPPGHERSKDGIIVTPPSPKTPEPETPSAPIETPDLTPADSIRQSAGELPEASDNCSPHVRAGARPEVQVKVEVKDQVEVQVEVEGLAPPAAAATLDPDAARVWEAWHANMPGTKSQVVTDGVNGLLGEYSAAEIVEAIAIACRRHKRSLSYIQGILQRGVFGEKPTPIGGDYKPPPYNGNGRMSPAEKGEAAASELRAMMVAHGKESVLHG